MPGFLLALLGIAAVLTTQGFDGFRTKKPDFQDVTVSSEGIVRLAPALEKAAAFDETAVWAIAETRAGTFVGTGSSGRVYLVKPGADTAGVSAVVFEAGQGQILALCASAEDVYFGLTPGGKVFRMRPGSKPVEFCDTKAEYVFALLPGPDKSIYCATGGSGRLFRIGPAGKTETVFTATQAHLTALAWLKPGRELLVGTSPDGLVYRLLLPADGKPQVSVLYDTQLEEIRSLAVTGSGQVTIAANPAEATGLPEPGAGPQAQGTGPWVGCVDSDGQLRWEAAIPESTVFALLPRPDGVLVGTGNNGAVYLLDSLGRPAMIQATEEPQVICFAPGESDLPSRASSTPGRFGWLGTSNPAVLYRIGDKLASRGHIISRPFDCGARVRFGRLSHRGRTPAGTELAFDTRSGDSESPDSTWSQWQKLDNEANVRSGVQSPSARFVQWRCRLKSETSGQTPELLRVDVHYETPNRPPRVTRLEFAELPPDQAEKGQSQPVRTITWTAEDPDGDSLVFALSYKAEDEDDWREVAADVSDSSFDLDTRTLPDGWYRLRLRASDRGSRSAATALSSEETSLPVLVDNSAPVLSEITLNQGRIVFSARDEHSNIAACRVAVNAGEWQRCDPVDRIFDSPEERFEAAVATAEVSSLKPGRNTVAVWVTDSQGNAATDRKRLTE